MKLYDVPRNSPLRVWVRKGNSDVLDEAHFGHIDGMYSFCLTSTGKPFHLSASTPMKLVEGRYEIDHDDTENN